MAPLPPSDTLLQPPTSPPTVPTRRPSTYTPLPTYHLPTSSRTYTQQFSDLYFSRLALLKPATSSHAHETWSGFRLGKTAAQKVERVLDVRQGDLCYVVGTVFMEMPLKPNVLEDVGREEWISAPVNSLGKFFEEKQEEEKEGTNGVDTGAGGKKGGKNGFAQRRVMLEDESGRLRLTGEALDKVLLVTGAIVAVLGTENRDGEFEVLDLRVPDLPRQPARWEKGDAERVVKKEEEVGERERAGKIALVSGLGISGEDGDMLALEMLGEYLTGEAGAEGDVKRSSEISRLFVLGNSLQHGGPIPTREELASKRLGARKYGYDSSSYNSAPTDMLDNWLAGLLPSLPVTLLPGDSDPTQAALPQQPMHAALFPRARAYMPQPPPVAANKKTEPERVGWFHSVTNPWEGEVDGWRVLATGGQPIDDMCRYVRGDDRIEIMESTLRWRVVAPTAPDTLWCYPFQEGDAFVLKACPHIYLVGNQPHFDTNVIEGPNGQAVRLIAVPKFKETGEIVLLDAETMEVEVVKFELFGGD
ncbi:DNA polymerase subunit delta-2 [Sphaceloma murrayae]|uniref:DNA polymerase subunit delta-2 n=1 Tax=Sphaceloma murrayae TaxID=2082308 RepID=A0A2K1QRR9_9PEZI|nr:DNA polymerase subunit delta-2 [Sphaceloma murrayae]